MKANEIRELSMQELNTKLSDLKSELFNLRFQLATGQLNNPVSIRNTKKDIARVATIIMERELKAKIADKKEVN
jgi:large subunit ribosomal protein L29